VRRFLPPLCPTCGAPVLREGDPATPGCPICLAAPLAGIARAGALGPHEGALRDIVHALKYRRHPRVARTLGRLLREALPDLLQACAAAVPVPLHAGRRRQRGFNQAEEIARHLGLPVLPALRRVRDTRPQTELDPRARRRNVEGAFRVRQWLRLRHALASSWHLARDAQAPAASGPLEGRTLLLVDDVWTTGSTLSACAGALRNAGAREVHAVVIARAGPPPLR
jgi:predicted amidophosphoribosyltransferase